MKKTTLSLLTALVLSTGTMCSAMKDAKEEAKTPTMDAHAQTSGQPVRVLPVSTSDTSGSLSSLSSSSTTGFSSSTSASVMASEASQFAALQGQRQELERQRLELLEQKNAFLQQQVRQLESLQKVEQKAPQQQVMLLAQTPALTMTVPVQAPATIVRTPATTPLATAPRTKAETARAITWLDGLEVDNEAATCRKHAKAALRENLANTQSLSEMIESNAPKQEFRSYRSPYDLIKMVYDCRPWGKNSTDFSNNTARIIITDEKTEISTLKIPVLAPGESKTVAVYTEHNDTATNTKRAEWYLVTFEARYKGIRDWALSGPLRLGKYLADGFGYKTWFNHSDDIDETVCPIDKTTGVREDYKITKLPQLDPGYKRNFCVTLENQVTYQIKIHRSVVPTAFRKAITKNWDVFKTNCSYLGYGCLYLPYKALTLPQTVSTKVLEKALLWTPYLNRILNRPAIQAIFSDEVTLSAADLLKTAAEQGTIRNTAYRASAAHNLATTLVAISFITAATCISTVPGAAVLTAASNKIELLAKLKTALAPYKTIIKLLVEVNLFGAMANFAKAYPKTATVLAPIFIGLIAMGYASGSIDIATVNELPKYIKMGVQTTGDMLIKALQSLGLCSSAATTSATTAAEVSVETLTLKTAPEVLAKAKEMNAAVQQLLNLCASANGKGLATCIS